MSGAVPIHFCKVCSRNFIKSYLVEINRRKTKANMFVLPMAMDEAARFASSCSSILIFYSFREITITTSATITTYLSSISVVLGGN
jgi:hypothetical protein